MPGDCEPWPGNTNANVMVDVFEFGVIPAQAGIHAFENETKNC